MKFVVFGEQKRVGLLEGDSVIDVNNAAAKYLAEKRGAKSAAEEAAVNAPANLTAFIEAGDRALDLTREAAQYVHQFAPVNNADELLARGGEDLLPRQCATPTLNEAQLSRCLIGAVYV